jgi:hypothetical protein
MYAKQGSNASIFSSKKLTGRGQEIQEAVGFLKMEVSEIDNSKNNG